MDYELRPMTDRGIGAEILGLDLTQPVSGELKQRLNTDFANHHVLAIRQQKFGPEQFLNAGRIFGDIMPHHRKSGDFTSDTSIFEIRNQEIAPGKYYIAGETFHTDHSNDPVPPKATSLHPIELPSKGGDTQFVTMHRAYDDLPDAMKKRVDKLIAVHVYVSKYSPRALHKVGKEDAAKIPPPGPRIC